MSSDYLEAVAAQFDAAQFDEATRHRWSGWPGAFCVRCGAEDMAEICGTSHEHADLDPERGICVIPCAALQAPCLPARADDRAPCPCSHPDDEHSTAEQIALGYPVGCTAVVVDSPDPRYLEFCACPRRPKADDTFAEAR